ncbi:MAG: hypothetical protein ACYTEQ_04855 [Planctomycetota bacterium]
MRVLRLVLKWWRRLWRATGNLQTTIDSHRWESKVEILKSLSPKRS